MKYEVGDNVRIVRNTSIDYADSHFDKYIGVVTTVTSACESQMFPYSLRGVPGGWRDAELELVKETAPDNVNHPSHYTQGGIECIDALKAATASKKGIEAVCTANIIKYLWRYEEKNGIEDLKKAEWYLKRLIREVSANN